MAFEVKVLAHSVGAAGIPVATMQLKYPRFIHAEFMTHRVFSRNASSSRAIPVAKMIEQVRNNPAMPVHWGKNQPGMQANEELVGSTLADAKRLWLAGANAAADAAEDMAAIGVHKQVANRILEPFQWMHVVVTATEWENFFALRCHKDAQPEIKHLAEMMRDALAKSTPEKLKTGEWHLPYIKKTDWQYAYFFCKEGRVTRDEPSMDEMRTVLIKVSAARCARVSYLTHDGRETTIAEDLALYERLAGGQPIHASPLEHQASPDHLVKLTRLMKKGGEWANGDLHGNLRGWIQFRKTVAGEYVKG